MNQKDYTNIGALALIQGSNALLPLVIFPYLLSIVGVDFFSKLVVTENIAMIILGIVIYSFEIDGVSKISGLDIRKERLEISRIFSLIFLTRIILFSMCFFCTVLVTYLVERDYLIVILGWILVPLAYIFQSFWFFQGIEQNIAVAFFTFFSRLLCCTLVYIFVNTPSDFVYGSYIIGGSYLIGGISSFLHVILYYGINLKSFRVGEIKESLYQGKEIFFGNMAVYLYRDFNILIMNTLLIDASIISIYAIVEKYVKALQAIIRPLNQFFFPKVISKFRGLRKPNQLAIKIIMSQTIVQLYILLVILCIVILGFLYLLNFTNLFDSIQDIHRMLSLFMLMSLAMFFGIFNFMAGSAGLNFLGEKVYFFKSLFFVGLLSTIFCSIFTLKVGEFGAGLSFLLSEIALSILILRKYIWSDSHYGK